MTTYLNSRRRDHMSMKGISLGPRVAGDLNPSFLTMRRNRLRTVGESLEEAYLRYVENSPSVMETLDLPTVAPSTSGIAEAPVSTDEGELTVLTIPTISASAALT